METRREASSAPTLRRALLLSSLCAALGACSSDDEGDGKTPPADERPPNILFIVVDDIGVDLFESFGYGGVLTPAAQVPSIDAIAEGGVRFRNAWSMPTCSPTRASIFTGEYPSTHGVMNAITSQHLAQSQVSPYTVTVPKLLEEKGYTSALIGKMHLAGSNLGPDFHPMGDGAMRELGFDYFAGHADGAPYPIDTTAGGVAPVGTYPCGMVPLSSVDAENGADEGVCYFADGGFREMAVPEYRTPGRTCVEEGGIFDPSGAPPSEERWAELDFETQNAYYTVEWTVNHEDGRNEVIPPSDPRARGYRSTLETDWAIRWLDGVRERDPEKPWMLSVGYSSLHTPLQPPPAALLPNEDAALSLLGCGTPVADALARAGGVSDLADFVQARAVAQHMLEALDFEIGRLLVAAGVLIRKTDGSLRVNEESDTVVVLVGDNGTYAPTVKLPFDFQRAKGTPYQTGIWVPLLVAGPVVEESDRDVEAMVNVTDLYRLFAEVAGIDVDARAQALRLDAQPVLPYLKDASQPSIRSFNFTEVGTNAAVVNPPPCVIEFGDIRMCVEIFPQKEVCEDQGGVWYGAGSDMSAEGFANCCEVNAYLEEQEEEPTTLYPHSQRAIRNEDYKLVRIETFDCASGELASVDELYVINQSRDRETLELDRAEDDLLAGRSPDALAEVDRQNYDALVAELEAILTAKVDCPGDGNRDGKIDQSDLDEWERWSKWGLTSWYDLDLDGFTDDADKKIIEENLGTTCPL